MKLVVLVLLLVSCASKPQLYPNAKFKKVGKDIAENDVNKCIEDADNYVKSSKGKKIAKSAGVGAIIGAAIGTVGGMFTGNVGRGLIRGGAMGAAGGGAVGALTPDQIKRNYVNQCLAEQNYQVIGWD
jgi:uncharacterized membrane protein